MTLHVDKKKLKTFFVFAFLAIVLDQLSKQIFLNGYRYDNEVFSLVLTYNKGVAFSMFAFLEHNLKWIQIALILGLFTYIIYEQEMFAKFYTPFGVIMGSGLSNIIDRFIHQGVVDFFYWHYWFRFAVFNLADVFINLAVAFMLYLMYKEKKNAKHSG